MIINSLLILIKDYLKFKSMSRDEKKFVFYSEGAFYTKYYIDLALKLNDLSNTIILTSELKEKNYLEKQKLKTFYIGNGEIRKNVLSNLNCHFFFLTLTDIGKNFKKSLKVKKYIYYFHSLGSLQKIYKDKAFNEYDIFFINGDYQVNEIKKIEEKYKLKKKEIVKTGYLYLNYLKKNADHNKTIKNQILYAPSWNYDTKNFFNDYSIKLIKILLDSDFKVVLRPHFEHYKRSKKILSNIKDNFVSNSNFSLDSNSDNLQSLETSEILITDNSLISTEFALVFKKRVIFVDYVDKIHNEEFKKNNTEVFEELFKSKIGEITGVNNIKDLPDLCRTQFNKIDYEKKIRKFKEDTLYDYEESLDISFNYLKDLYLKN